MTRAIRRSGDRRSAQPLASRNRKKRKKEEKEKILKMTANSDIIFTTALVAAPDVVFGATSETVFGAASGAAPVIASVVTSGVSSGIAPITAAGAANSTPLIPFGAAAVDRAFYSDDPDHSEGDAMSVDHTISSDEETRGEEPRDDATFLNEEARGEETRISDKESKRLRRELRQAVLPPNVFEGNDCAKAEGFLMEVKTYLSLSGLLEARHRGGMYEQTCCAHFGKYLSGEARVWYNAYGNNLTGPWRYDDLVGSFTNRFTSRNREQDALENLRTPQGKNETLQGFVLGFRNRLSRYEAVSERPLSSQQKVESFLSGLTVENFGLARNLRMSLASASLDEVIDGLSVLDANANVLKRIEAKRIMPDQAAQRHQSPKSGGQKRRRQDAPSAPSPEKCTFCKKRGHTATDCFSRKKASGSNQIERKRENAPFAGINPSEPIKVNGKVNKHLAYFTIDSYSGLSLITREKAKSLGLQLLPNPNPPTITLGDNSTFKGAGKWLTEPVELSFGDHRETFQFHVVPKCISPIILGLDWLRTHNPLLNFQNDTVTFPSCCHAKDSARKTKGNIMTFAFGTEQKVLTLEFDGEASVKLSSLKGVHEIESLKHHSPSEIHRTETDNAARSEPNAPHVLQPDTNSSGED